MGGGGGLRGGVALHSLEGGGSAGGEVEERGYCNDGVVMHHFFT